MIISNLPDYVEGGGRHQVWRPPYRAKGAELLGLVLEADQAAIDTLLKRDLVDPAGGAVDYRCAHPNIIVTLADIADLRSTDPPDSGRGFLPERELSIWCLAADQTAGERLVWYLPYVFTDSGQTVATGREVYGYPKQIGTFDAGYPDVLGTAGATTTIKGLAIDVFGQQAQAELRDLVKITRQPGTGTPPIPPAPTWARELRDYLYPGGFSVDIDVDVSPPPAPSATITASASTPPPGPPPAPPQLKPVIQALTGTQLSEGPDALAAELAKSPTLVFLKQFRDIRCPTKACYQAVTEAAISIDPVGASYQALDPALFAVTVSNWATHPVAAELGLTPGAPLVPDRAFRATLTFDIMTGLEVWRAPT